MSLQVILGPMFSGKTTELSRRLRRAQLAGRAARMFKSILDSRYNAIHVVSHDGTEVSATPVGSLSEILLEKLPSIIGIDEAQFFDITPRELQITREVARSRDIIVAGLDMDAFGKPFHTMKELTAVADDVLKLKAVCVRCGADAGYTQRIVEGYPITEGTPIQVGGFESYEARCIECFDMAELKEKV